MEVIYTTSAIHFSGSCELSQRASSERQTVRLPGRKSKVPQIFTFEPILQSEKPKRRKRRSLKILYPYRQVRSLPTEKDTTKRLLMLFLSIVLFQVYTTAAEDELTLPAPEQVSTFSSQAPAPSAVLSVVLLPPSAAPGAENNCSQVQPAAGH
ncbi:uncharacterized protein LOC144497845 [Mustelus asterias]